MPFWISKTSKYSLRLLFGGDYKQSLSYKYKLFKEVTTNSITGFVKDFVTKTKK